MSQMKNIGFQIEKVSEQKEHMENPLPPAIRRLNLLLHVTKIIRQELSKKSMETQTPTSLHATQESPTLPSQTVPSSQLLPQTQTVPSSQLLLQYPPVHPVPQLPTPLQSTPSLPSLSESSVTEFLGVPNVPNLPSIPGWFNIPVTENLSTTSILQTSSTPTGVELTLPQTSTTLTTSIIQAPSTFTGVELTTPQTSTTQTSSTFDLSSLNLQNITGQTTAQTPHVTSKTPRKQITPCKQIHSRATTATATHQVSSEMISEENFMLVESSDNEDDSGDKDFTVDDSNNSDDNDNDDENEDRTQQQPSTSTFVRNVKWTHNHQQGNPVPKALQNPRRLYCNKCPRSYTTMWDLKIHKANRCGKKNDKPYKCPVCQRGFANVIGMREHKRGIMIVFYLTHVKNVETNFFLDQNFLSTKKITTLVKNLQNMCGKIKFLCCLSVLCKYVKFCNCRVDAREL